MYYVYILLSLKDNNFYFGSTSDLKRRICEHRLGKVISTKHRLPIKLVCYEAYASKEQAQRREKFLKSSDGKKDIRKRLGTFQD
ncbi:MAG: GIY-YIG nuclease family protein [Candidatus Moranbacteria bacterium]|nr:GIY-YIG nuclease family protein [Candidatus Moranbacteria bacterium]